MRPPPADLSIRPARPDEQDLVARVRTRCYRGGHGAQTAMREGMDDAAASLEAGDVLLAERGGRFLATVTSLRGEMNVRGAVVPTQGIAWVGTTHDARRSGGLASATMWKAIELARDRRQVLSALMPFRASYYEHFGYGLAERRALWTVPVSVLPQPARDTPLTFELVDPEDEDRLTRIGELRSRQFRHPVFGHGDVTFPHVRMNGFGLIADDFREDGYLFVDLDPDTGEPRGALGTHAQGTYGDKAMRATWMIHDSPAGFVRMLEFMSTWRDQYSRVEFATPGDLRVERLLREPQLPHRGVEHPFATCEIANRNQVRVLDHGRMLEAMPWPAAEARGRVIVAVAESEGHESRFELSFDSGRCETKPTQATPTFTCADKVWAPILLGDIGATFALQHGLAQGDTDAAAHLDVLLDGPAPFCRESF